MVSAVGLSWETSTSPYDSLNGPRLVGAKLNYVGDRPIGEGFSSSFIAQFAGNRFAPNSEFDLYHEGDFRLRMLTTGGFSPDGVRSVLPTDYEKFFRIHVRGVNSDTVLMIQDSVDYQVLGGSLRVVGLSDLGAPEGGDIVYGDCYIEDRDNYIDIILTGDTAAARNILFLEIPSLEGGYSAFYSPGGPGTTPFPGEAYTQPGPRDLEPVIIALDDPMRVTYDVRPEVDSVEFISYNTFNIPFLPEGIEYDPMRESFLTSSALTGAINLVRTDGLISNLIPGTEFNGNGTFGLQIDTLNDRLLVVVANIQNPTVAQLFRFNLTDASLIDSVDLASLNPFPGLTFVNDVAVDNVGNAYVTNSDQGIIYKVDTAGLASIFFQDNSLAPPNPFTDNGFNGIEYHPDGFLLVVHSANDRIYKIMLNNPSQATEVSLPDGYLRSGDGMYVDGNELVVVSNTVNTPANPVAGAPRVPFVTKFVTSDDWNSAVPEGDTYATGNVFPTTVVKVNGEYFINYAYFNYLIDFQIQPTDYLISKASFDVNQRFSGSATEIPRVNTPVVPFSYGTEYPEPYYASCTTPIESGVPNLSGEWVEAAVTINGVEITPQPMLRRERIEQCGNRILIASGGVLQEVFHADNTIFNGINDADPTSMPSHFIGRFESEMFLLSPIIPGDTVPGPAITREIVQDDAGNMVLKLFQPASGTTRYLVEESTITSLQEVAAIPMVTVAPNPFRDQTVVSWKNQNHEPFQAQLVNLTGKVVRNYPRVTGESLLIEKGSLSPGIYFLRLFSHAGKVESVKLLLQE
ncbi:MAG: T9SS type A sorting domain-containing protein [Bacteroidota bacterium]